MSVIVVGTLKADRAKMDELFREKADTFRSIREEAERRGARHHCFGAGPDGILLLDEWDSRENFESFFGSDQRIPQLMQQAGVQGPPELRFYEVLDSPDRF